MAKIAYNPEEYKNSVIYLPRLSFKLTDSQKHLLELIESEKYASIKDLSEKSDLSTAMLYRAMDELRDMDLIEEGDFFKLTDAGKIARL